jgi:hypothetical protein
MQFPDVTGSNLNRDSKSFPADFEGDLNLLFIAFQRWQQTSINTWLPLANALEAQYKQLVYYEFPTIQSMNPLFQRFIDGGMRAGIPDPKARERTITLYLDKGPFRSALGITNEDYIYVLLVRQDGDVLWMMSGELTADKEESLRAAIEKTGASSDAA